MLSEEFSEGYKLNFENSVNSIEFTPVSTQGEPDQEISCAPRLVQSGSQLNCKLCGCLQLPSFPGSWPKGWSPPASPLPPFHQGWSPPASPLLCWLVPTSIPLIQAGPHQHPPLLPGLVPTSIPLIQAGSHQHPLLSQGLVPTSIPLLTRAGPHQHSPQSLASHLGIFGSHQCPPSLAAILGSGIHLTIAANSPGSNPDFK